MATRLGELLVRKGYITPEQLGKACEAQKQHDGLLGAHLVSLGCLTEERRRHTRVVFPPHDCGV